MANLYFANAKLSPDATACEIKQKFFSYAHDAIKEAYKWKNCGPDMYKNNKNYYDQVSGALRVTLECWIGVQST